MSKFPFTALALACATTFAASASAATPSRTELTLYRSDDASLFNIGDGGSVGSGYAMAREPRQLDLKQGVQDISLGGLPAYLDTEALSLSVEGDAAQVLSQRLRLAQGRDAALGSLIGQPIEVLGSNGQALASGTLLRAGDGLLVSDAGGRTSLIRDYAAVRASGHFNTGSSLELRVDATRAGRANAVLSYPTAGLGWRAAYIGTLLPGNACKLRFESRASIANRSGRDWNGVGLTLIAGEPQITRTPGPGPVMAMAYRGKAEAADMPQQGSVADYRSFTLPGAVDLPDGSVSQVPLYATRQIDCERTLLYETGGRWTPPQPMINRDFNNGGGNTVTSTLRLRAFDSLPAGNLRVLTADRNGTPQFIGEGRIEDTPKGADATITLGKAFDLRAERERTDFKLDKAGRSMDESFRITLTNAGDAARTVTVREHPNRWREWTLVSSSIKPSEQKPDLLEFRIDIPAGGKATLDYAVRYRWGETDQPQQ